MSGMQADGGRAARGGRRARAVGVVVAAALGAAALAAVVPPAAATGAASVAPATRVASSDAALTKERLYRLTLSRTYGRPVVLDVPAALAWPRALTDSGVVVGSCLADGVDDRWCVFRWRDGRTEMLPRQGAEVDVVDVNERGQVVGVARGADPAGPITLFVWQPDGTVVHPALDAGSVWTSVGGITDEGAVVAAVDGTRVVTWRDGVLTDLEVPGERVHLSSWAQAVAADGTFAATVTGGDGRDRAYVWRDGVPSPLPAPADGQVRVDFIGDHGHVVGWIDDRVVVWSGGRVRDVDPKGRYGLSPTAVNRHGTVVGHAHLRGPARSDARGVVTLLPGLGGSEEHVADVHDLEIAVGAVDPTQWGAYPQPVMWVVTVPVRLGTRVDGVDVRGGEARAVNTGGQVVGTLYVEPTETDRRLTRVALWDLRPG